MAVPKFDEFMLPFLQHVADGEEHRIRDLFDAMARMRKKMLEKSGSPNEATPVFDAK